MKKYIRLIQWGVAISLLFLTLQGQAQWMIIDEDGGTPHASAALEIDDTSRGLLPPRLTTNQMNSVSSPAEGLMIYNSDSSTYYFFDGTSWVNIGSGGSSSGTVVSTDWVEYTPTYVGLGTVTVDTFYWRREGPDVLIRGKFTKGGSGTAVEAQVSLPSGLTISSNIATPENAGTAAWAGGATNTAYTILIDPGDDHFGFGYSSNASGALVKSNGNIIFSNNSTQVVTARIPVQGWSGSSSSSVDTLDENTFSAIITATPVVTSESQNFIQSVSKLGTGQYRVTWVSGFFTENPAVVTSARSAALRSSVVREVTTTYCDIYTYNASSAQDAEFQIFAMRQGNDYKYNAAGASASSSNPQDLDSVLATGNDAGNDTIKNLGLIGLGTTSPTASIDIQKTTENFSISIANTLSSSSDKKGVFANVTGVGNGDNYGLYGAANNNTAASDKYGVYGEAGGTAGTTYGIYGTATGSSAWAGYFNNGNVYVDNSVGIGTTTLDSVVNVNGSIMAHYIRLTGGAVNGYVLTSDGQGNATWQMASGASSDTATTLADTDRDTYISTQNSSGADSDTLGFTIGGSEQYQFNSGGQILVPGGNASVYLGTGVGNGNGSFGNTVMGFKAFELATSSVNNVAIGTQTMGETTTGGRNTAVGPYAMHYHTTGIDNTALGYAAGYGTLASKMTGSSNVFIGKDAGLNTTSGSRNVLVGHDAGRNVTAGNNNIFLGYQAGNAETGDNKLYIENSGSSNPLIWGDFANDSLKVYGTLSIGDSTTFPTTRGSNGQVLTSDGAGGISWQTPSSGSSASLADADNDTKIQVEESTDEDIIRFDLAGTERFVMKNSRLEMPNSGQSIFLGTGAGAVDDLANNQNVYIGDSAGAANVTSGRNVAIGYFSMSSATSGNNTAIGYSTLQQVGSPGQHNVAVGWSVLQATTTGGTNTALGSAAMQANTTGSRNTSVGYRSLRFNLVGDSSTAVGYHTLEDNLASRNTAIGNSAMLQNTTGTNNVALGVEALRENLTGEQNVAIGMYSGETNTSGSRNIYLGYNAGASASGDDQLYIENSNSSKPLIWGDFANDSLKVYGTLSIGDSTTFPTTRGVNGQVLTSDGAGGITWQSVNSSSWLTSGSNTYYSAGNVGIGTSSPNALLTLASSTAPVIRVNSYGSTLSDDANLYLSRARGSEGSEASVVNNDQVGQVVGAAHDGSTYGNIAKIAYHIDGAPGTGDLPGRIQFHTTEDGSNSTTERMRITSAGEVGIGVTAPAAKLDVLGDLGINATPSSDAQPNGITSTATVDGSTSGAARGLYIKSNGNYDLTDADAAATMPCVALAIETGTGSKKIIHYGFVSNTSWSWTVGGLIYVSTTTGELTQTAPTGTGDQVQVVGYATTSTTLFFNPSYVVIEVGP